MMQIDSNMIRVMKHEPDLNNVLVYTHVFPEHRHLKLNVQCLVTCSHSLSIFHPFCGVKAHVCLRLTDLVKNRSYPETLYGPNAYCILQLFTWVNVYQLGNLVMKLKSAKAFVPVVGQCRA